ncbi:MAG: DUF2480 family protein [Bacteroidetes bacterium]|nr:DUF2480 family protein [Bacteroidota bacterium]MBK9671157.1 DUF2480 family protein [Bacteroidota bacterium]MBP6412235.1 DUF2480 family protein [Bacteroidia bacterium]
MEITNKVAASGLITLDLEEFYPEGERVLVDIKEQLFQGLILREKEFRAFIQDMDWSTYRDKFVAITCSTDAIVPTWAYMLLTAALAPFAKKIVFGNLEQLEQSIFQETLAKLNLTQYKDARIVVKGCGKLPIPKGAFVELTSLLQPLAKSIMYGEPCSTVPLYKRKD